MGSSFPVPGIFVYYIVNANAASKLEED